MDHTLIEARIHRLIARDTLTLFARWNCRARLWPSLDALRETAESCGPYEADRHGMLYLVRWADHAARLWGGWRLTMEDLAHPAFVALLPDAVPRLYKSFDQARREADKYATPDPPRLVSAGRLLWDTDGAGRYVYPGLVRIFRDRVLLRVRRSAEVPA